MRIRIKTGRFTAIKLLPTVIISCWDWSFFWYSWAIEIHIFRWAVGVCFERYDENQKTTKKQKK